MRLKIAKEIREKGGGGERGILRLLDHILKLKFLKGVFQEKVFERKKE